MPAFCVSRPILPEAADGGQGCSAGLGLLQASCKAAALRGGHLGCEAVQAEETEAPAEVELHLEVLDAVAALCARSHRASRGQADESSKTLGSGESSRQDAAPDKTRGVTAWVQLRRQVTVAGKCELSLVHADKACQQPAELPATNVPRSGSNDGSEAVYSIKCPLPKRHISITCRGIASSNMSKDGKRLHKL